MILKFVLLLVMFQSLASFRSSIDAKFSYFVVRQHVLSMSAAESFPSLSTSASHMTDNMKNSLSSSSEDSSTSTVIDSNVWDESKVKITQRVEESKKLLHTEVFTNSWALPLLLKLPKQLHRPVAKMGIRTYSASGEMMDNIISNIYGPESNSVDRVSKSTTVTDEKEDALIPRRAGRPIIDASYIRSRSYHPSALPPPGPKVPRKFHSVALFVYMWVDPKYRKLNYGDYLLTLAMDMCRERGDEYMLLVHDDDGTGRLINYYVNRGFVPIFNFIEKGMIYKL